MATENELSRRNFTALLAASSSAWALLSTNSTGSGALLAADDKNALPAKDSKADAPAAEPQEKPAAVGTPTAAELALHLLLARFPDDRLDPAAQASLLIDIERHQARSRTLAQVELANGDEPGFLFAAYRRPEAMER